jgi:hypothetical protein
MNRIKSNAAMGRRQQFGRSFNPEFDLIPAAHRCFPMMTRDAMRVKPAFRG